MTDGRTDEQAIAYTRYSIYAVARKNTNTQRETNTTEKNAIFRYVIAAVPAVTGEWWFEGNLHIANVRLEDARNGSSYLCVVMNDELRSLAQGDDQKIEPVTLNGIYLSPSLRHHSYIWLVIVMFTFS